MSGPIYLMETSQNRNSGGSNKWVGSEKNLMEFYENRNFIVYI